MVQIYDLDRQPGEYRRGDIYARNDGARVAAYAGPHPEEVPGPTSEYTEDFARLAASQVHSLLPGRRRT